jgi:DNA-binding NarL/FixJ family response regulator
MNRPAVLLPRSEQEGLQKEVAAGRGFIAEPLAQGQCFGPGTEVSSLPCGKDSIVAAVLKRERAMKVLVVDDHVLIREALRGVLKELKGDAQILEAPDARNAKQRIADNADLELVLLDLHLPDGSGFDLLAELRERRPEVSVVMLSASNDRDDIARALKLGALGFIPKSAHRDVMLSAFKLIFSGGIYVPPEILAPRDAPSIAALPRGIAADLGLTDRQLDVLNLMMQGKSNKAICRALDLAEPTVKNHVTAILKALNASNRTEAVIAAGALGIGADKKAG